MRKFLGVVFGLMVLIIVGAWLKLRGPDIPFETLEAKYAQSDSRFVDLPGGYRVHYREDGDPNAPLLVLLHGFADSFTTWDGWVRELKPQFHIISLDFPGHGLTRAPEGSSLNAEALADFVDALHRNRCCRSSRLPAIPWAAARRGNWPCGIRNGSTR
jgi:hypothetical protein